MVQHYVDPPPIFRLVFWAVALFCAILLWRWYRALPGPPESGEEEPPIGDYDEDDASTAPAVEAMRTPESTTEL